jgi:hypothetical protein
MRDGILDLGTVALATADTQVYGTTTLDFGAISSKYTKDTRHRAGSNNLCAVFQVTVAFANGDSGIPILQDSADDSSFADMLWGKQTPTTGLAVGNRIVLPMPRQHRRYVRASAMPRSTGTFGDSTFAVWLEPGPNHGTN